MLEFLLLRLKLVDARVQGFEFLVKLGNLGGQVVEFLAILNELFLEFGLFFLFLLYLFFGLFLSNLFNSSIVFSTVLRQ